jgi:hypothetical protein
MSRYDDYTDTFYLLLLQQQGETSVLHYKLIGFECLLMITTDLLFIVAGAWSVTGDNCRAPFEKMQF